MTGSKEHDKLTVLTLIRHAQTEWNEEGRLQGRTDVQLSERGRSILADWKRPPGSGQMLWFSSPLSRALETARAMCSEPIIEPRLIEVDWGRWEGKTLAEIGRSQSCNQQKAELGYLDFHAPGGESPSEVHRRIQSWLREVAGLRRSVVAVTHKGIIEAVLTLAVGHSAKPVKIARNCRHVFHLDPKEAPRVGQMNISMLSESGSDAESIDEIG